MIQNKEVLKTYFEEGDKPTQNQFSDLIDSMADSSQVGYPIFNIEVNYKMGDIVNHEGNLYKFTMNHSSGPWLGTDVEKASIRNELTILKERSVVLTEEEYNSLKEKDDNKLYFVLEDE